MYEYIYLINLEGRVRRKIRLIEGNAKCRHLKNLPVKGLCGRCYLSEAQSLILHPLTHCIRVYSILIYTGKGGGESITREKGIGATGESTDHKAGFKIPT
jgi:hypothetical protein